MWPPPWTHARRALGPGRCRTTTSSAERQRPAGPRVLGERGPRGRPPVLCRLHGRTAPGRAHLPTPSVARSPWPISASCRGVSTRRCAPTSRRCGCARQPGGPVLRGTADMYVGMSEIHRERDDVPAATQYLLTSEELGEHTGLPQNPYRWRVAMARLREAEGDLDGALELLEDAERLYVSDFFPDVRPVPALRARVQLAAGSWPRRSVGHASGGCRSTTTSATCASSSTSPWPGCSWPGTRSERRSTPCQEATGCSSACCAAAEAGGGPAASSKSWCCRRSRSSCRATPRPRSYRWSAR